MRWWAGAELSDFKRARTKFHTALDDVARDAVTFTTERGRDTAKRVGKFKDRTGELRGSIRNSTTVRMGEEHFGYLVAPTIYASWVEGGTNRHWVGPVVGTAMKFEVDGKTRFSSGHYHPGSNPYPFMGPAYIAMEAALIAYLEREIPQLESVFNG